jgi:hypothetical protein
LALPGYAGGAWVLVARAAELLALSLLGERCGGCSKVAADFVASPVSASLLRAVLVLGQHRKLAFLLYVYILA